MRCGDTADPSVCQCGLNLWEGVQAQPTLAKLKLTQLSMQPGLAFVLWSISLSEKSVLWANRKFSCSQTQGRGCAVTCALLAQGFVCHFSEGSTGISSCTTHWGFLLPEQSLGIFQGTTTGINDSYCLQQILFLWFICHRKLGFWM